MQKPKPKKPAYLARKSVFTIVKLDAATGEWSEHATKNDEGEARDALAKLKAQGKLYGPDRKLIGTHNPEETPATSRVPVRGAQHREPAPEAPTQPHAAVDATTTDAMAGESERLDTSFKFALPARMLRNLEVARKLRRVAGSKAMTVAAVIRLAVSELFEKHGIQ